MSGAFSLDRAGHWFLHSGIQGEAGGVARFYRADLKQNRAVSTEITGYAASALMYLFNATQDEEYLDRARLTASYLRDHAWNKDLQIFPYEELDSDGNGLSFFFDSGIIIRGLIAVWRETHEDSLIGLASLAAHGMLRDFRNLTGEFEPIVALPSKHAIARGSYWSKEPGCYQAKSALSWFETAEITGDEPLRQAYFEVIETGLRTHHGFLSEDAGEGTMDRLHAYCYFLEALHPLLQREDCREAYVWGREAVARHLNVLKDRFVRSDVYAQLLRVHPDLDEATTALTTFQATSDDPRIDGGFYFGRRDGQLIPHVNPVSTAFALQALHMQQTQKAPSSLL